MVGKIRFLAVDMLFSHQYPLRPLWRNFFAVYFFPIAPDKNAPLRKYGAVRALI